MVWGGRREEGSGWGTHVYLSQIHFDIWQNQKNIVKFKKKKKKDTKINMQKKKNKKPVLCKNFVYTVLFLDINHRDWVYSGHR